MKKLIAIVFLLGFILGAFIQAERLLKEDARDEALTMLFGKP